MKYIKDYLEQQMYITPLGEVSTRPYESRSGDYTGEELFVNGKSSGIIIYYIDYIDWLEKNIANYGRTY